MRKFAMTAALLSALGGIPFMGSQSRIDTSARVAPHERPIGRVRTARSAWERARRKRQDKRCGVGTAGGWNLSGMRAGAQHKARSCAA